MLICASKTSVTRLVATLAILRILKMLGLKHFCFCLLTTDSRNWYAGIERRDLLCQPKACSHPRSSASNTGTSTALCSTRATRKNDAAVDRMCASIREFGCKIPVLACSDGQVVDGHLRLKAARKL